MITARTRSADKECFIMPAKLPPPVLLEPIFVRDSQRRLRLIMDLLAQELRQSRAPPHQHHDQSTQTEAHRHEDRRHLRASVQRARPVIEQTINHRTYRLEGIRCGKEKCKCTLGKLHGPYWYSYTRVKDKVTSHYIGKNLPKVVQKRMKS